MGQPILLGQSEITARHEKSLQVNGKDGGQVDVGVFGFVEVEVEQWSIDTAQLLLEGHKTGEDGGHVLGFEHKSKEVAHWPVAGQEIKLSPQAVGRVHNAKDALQLRSLQRTGED